MVRPKQRVKLLGIGREPVGTDQPIRYDEITSPAITHRYDLLAADPDVPSQPLRDAEVGASADGSAACGPYVCLDEKVAKIDRTSGEVKAGKGDHPPTFAVAMLSVGEHAATYPMLFEPSPSFRAAPPVVPRPGFGGAAIATPASPPNPTIPQAPSVAAPQIPPPPALVPPPPGPPATPPQPPVPPPVPPADAGPSPLSLSFAPTGLVVAPTASVIPPPAPPINPAPPGGARREARQRQAATQKSGAESADQGSKASDQTQQAGGDAADSPLGPQGSEMTRRDHAFTAYSARDEASPWTTGALYGGGITLLALAAALGWTHGRPTPRRRQPQLPAPAFSRARTRDRRR